MAQALQPATLHLLQGSSCQSTSTNTNTNTTMTIAAAPISSVAATRRARVSYARISRTRYTTSVPPIGFSLWKRSIRRASPAISRPAAAGGGRLARAQGAPSPSTSPAAPAGRVHVVPSTKETVRLGVFDANLPPVLTIDSGDVISFPDTWSHFLNEMQPGVSLEKLVELRVSNPGRGPHSIIGPIAVNKAEPGDVLEIRFQTIRPYEWAAVLNNPGSVGTGLLPQDYAQGQIKYVDLDLGAMQGKFMAHITVPLH